MIWLCIIIGVCVAAALWLGTKPKPKNKKPNLTPRGGTRQPRDRKDPGAPR